MKDLLLRMALHRQRHFEFQERRENTYFIKILFPRALQSDSLESQDSIESGGTINFRFAIFFFILFASICQAQTLYQGLTPGQSTRAHVDKALGPPVREVSQTLSEYKLSDGSGKIYVQFAQNSDITERIEIVLVKSSTRSEVLSKLNLPDSPSSSKVNSRGKLEEYFGSGKCLVLTHASSEIESDVVRIGYYSSKLFASATGTAAPSAQNAPPATTDHFASHPPQVPGQAPPRQAPGEDQPSIEVTEDPDNIFTNPERPDSSKKTPDAISIAGKSSVVISALKTNEANAGMPELTFEYTGPPGKINPQERLITPMQIQCGKQTITITMTALNVDSTSAQHGVVHVPLIKQ